MICRMRFAKFALLLACPTALIFLAPLPAVAQGEPQFESDLIATTRLLEQVGPGFRTIRRGPQGNYYVLTTPATAVQIYDPEGRRIGQIPSEKAAAQKGAALVFGESFDVDGDGRVAVDDLGANAVKLYATDGLLSGVIAVTGPAGVALLPGGEIAITSPNLRRLVTVFDRTGKLLREFGDPETIGERADVNRQVNLGHLSADELGDTYFAFGYLPEPTVRKFDRAGYLTAEISLTTLEFQPAAQAARRVIARAGRDTPALHRIVTGLGVDPQKQDVWLAIGTLLMHFDRDGLRLASFRTFAPGGARLEAVTILVEPDRLLIGTDRQGIYAFPRPDKIAP